MTDDRIVYRAGKNGCVDLIFSPDDGGWYAHEYDFKHHRDRVSQDILETPEGLSLLLKQASVTWDKWR